MTRLSGSPLCSAITSSARGILRVGSEPFGILSAVGYKVEHIDISTFLNAVALLYGGALVSKRFASVGTFSRQHPGQADPTAAKLVLADEGFSAHDFALAQLEAARYRLRARAELDGYDALVLPTTTGHPSIAQVRADPIATSSRLGAYTATPCACPAAGGCDS